MKLPNSKAYAFLDYMGCKLEEIEIGWDAAKNRMVTIYHYKDENGDDQQMLDVQMEEEIRLFEGGQS